jgi:pyrroline-5-carboxylate reductase
MKHPTIAFIGAGNMACGLIQGLLKANFPSHCIFASHHDAEKIERLKKQFPIEFFEDNHVAAEKADVIVLSVKPQKIKTVLTEIIDKGAIKNKVLISLAAGVTTALLEKLLGTHAAVVRVMPNLPSLVGTGATGLYANAKVTEDERDIAESIFRSVGVTVWVDHERDLDIITALSGSGPAYYFYFMKAMEQAAINMGLNAKATHLLITQTALGASRLALEEGHDFTGLIEQVSSSKGTTAAALEVFESRGLAHILEQALRAAHTRAEEITVDITKELG